MTAVLPATDTPFGERVARRLRDELIIWMTTTGADGTPQPNPVWFIWDGDTLLVYNRPDAKRLQHVPARPSVSLNFDSDRGGNVVVITGSETWPVTVTCVAVMGSLRSRYFPAPVGPLRLTTPFTPQKSSFNEASKPS